jgi:hypothetical protein
LLLVFIPLGRIGDEWGRQSIAFLIELILRRPDARNLDGFQVTDKGFTINTTVFNNFCGDFDGIVAIDGRKWRKNAVKIKSRI